MEEGDVNLTVGRLALEAKRNVEASSAASREPETLYFGKFKGPHSSFMLLFGMSDDMNIIMMIKGGHRGHEWIWPFGFYLALIMNLYDLIFAEFG